MRDAKLSRRSTLTVLGAIPLALLAGACGKKTEPDSCSDVTGLAEGDKVGRNALQYTDRSLDATKRCELCSLFQPASDPVQCAACQVVKGPIHPKGYCTAFAAKG